MAALDFPANPSVGDTYDVYTFDGEKWVIGGSDTAPPVVTEAPDWVPEGAIACVDFMGGNPQGRGWDGTMEYDGAGMVVMLGNDPDSDQYYSGSNYDPAGIQQTGYNYFAFGEMTGPAAIGNLKTMMINPEGLTFVLGFNLCDGHNNIWTFLNSSDGNAFWIFLNNLDLVSIGNDVRNFFSLGYPDIWTTDYDGRGMNRIAITLTPTLCEASMNGSAVRTQVLDATDWPDGPPIGFLWDGGDLMCLEIYPIQTPDRLPILSAVPIKVYYMFPDCAPLGGYDHDIVIVGENFSAGCVIQKDGVDMPTIVAEGRVKIAIAAMPTPTSVGVSIFSVKAPDGTIVGALEFTTFDPALNEKPPWLPEGASAYVDFMNTEGRGWDGVTVCTPAFIGYNLIGFDGNTSTYIAPEWSGYDETNVTPDGYDFRSENQLVPAYIGLLRDLVLADCTVVITYRSNIESSPTKKFAMVSADGLNAIEITMTLDVTVTSLLGPLNLSIPAGFTGPGSLNYVKNRIAFTSTASRFDIAANGSAAITSALDPLDGRASLVAICDRITNIDSIVVYPALTDTTGLSELSALEPPATIPDWVPEGASAHIDFLYGGQAWAGGVVYPDLSLVLGSDPNGDAILGGDPTLYDPQWLGPYGYNPDKGGFALIGKALEACYPGCTVAVTWHRDNTFGVPPDFIWVSADGLASVSLRPNGEQASAQSLSGGPLWVAAPVQSDVTPSDNRMAATFVPPRIDVSGNGGAPATGSIDPLLDTPSPLVAVVMCGGPITSITIYPPLADTTGLSEISSLTATRESRNGSRTTVKPKGGEGGSPTHRRSPDANRGSAEHDRTPGRATASLRAAEAAAASAAAAAARSGSSETGSQRTGTSASGAGGKES
jgi:hypothetical protein